MATANPFDLLGDDDNDDPSQLIAAAQQQKIATKKPSPAAAATIPAEAKLPSKPVPPTQAVREARSNNVPARGGGVGGSRGGFGRGRGGRGSAPGPRDYGNGSVNGFPGGYSGYSGGGGGSSGGGEDGDTGKPPERERGTYGGPRPPYRGGRRGGYGNGESGGDSERPPRRVFERHSGTGRGNELKRDGSGRGNWGTATDDVLEQVTEEVANTEDKVLTPEKQPEQEGAPASEANKESKEGAAIEAEEKEPEDKEMTLEEYEKVREEKRKALLAMKAEERKVNFDKEFESMKQLSLKKGQEDIFIKLGSDKDSKRRDIADRDERVKKSVSINEFLKPAEGGRYYSPGGRGRGRGRGDRGFSRGEFGGGGDNGGGNMGAAAPLIDDPGHFPTLGGKQ